VPVKRNELAVRRIRAYTGLIVRIKARSKHV